MATIGRSSDLAHLRPRQAAMTHLWEAKARRRNQALDCRRANPRVMPGMRSQHHGYQEIISNLQTSRELREPRRQETLELQPEERNLQNEIALGGDWHTWKLASVGRRMLS